MEAALAPVVTGDQGREVSGVDLGALYRRAVTHLHGGERGAWMSQDAVDEIARVASPAVEYGQTAAFVLATSLYEPTTDRRDPARAQAVTYLVEHLGVSRRSAYYACEQVDLVTLLKVDKVGVPSIRHLNEAVWSGVGRAGWGRLNAWLVKRGGFDRVSPAAVADYCQKVKEDAQSEAEEQARQAQPDDPYAPPEAEVVDGEPVESEPAVERREHHLQDTPPADGPPWANAAVCNAAPHVLWEAALDLARGTDEVIAETAAGLDMPQLRLWLAAGMIAIDRPPERVYQCLRTPSRDAVVKALQGLARMLRERVGVA